MNEIIAFAVLVLITFFGQAVLYFFGFLGSFNFYRKIPYGFALGCGLLSVYLFELGRLGHWQISQIIILPVSLILFTLTTKYARIKADLKFRLTFSRKDFILLLLILLTVAYTGFEVWLRPLYAWDGWASWLLKAKMFYLDGYFNPRVFNLIKDNYPYFINLIGTFIYQVIGGVDDRAVLLFFYFVYLMLGLSFYHTTKSLLFTFLLLSLQNVIRHGGRFEAGYADLTLALFIFLGFTLIVEYLSSRRRRTLFLLSLFLGLTTLVKVEGWVFALIISPVIYFHSRSLLTFFWLIPYLDWQIFKKYAPVSYNLYSGINLHLARIPRTIWEMFRETVNIERWNFLWPVFIVTLVIRRRLSTSSLLAIYIILFQITAYFLVFLVSPHPPEIHVPNVIDRLYLHITPLLVYVIYKVVFEKTDTDTGAATSLAK